MASWKIAVVSVPFNIGGAAVSSLRHPHITTWHVLVGAATLAMTWLLTFFLFRDRIEGSEAPV